MDQQREKTDYLYTVLNANGKILYASANTFDLIGFRNEELIGKYFVDYVHRDDVQTLVSYLQNQHHMYPCIFRMGYGEDFAWAEATLDYIQSVVGDADREEIVLKVILCDGKQIIPTEHKNVYTDGIDEKSYLNNLPSPLLITVNGIIQYANKEAIGLLNAGTDDSKLIGLNSLELIHDEYKEIFRNRIERLQKGGKIGIVEQTWRRLDGVPIEIEVKTSSIQYEQQRAELVVLLDISARKRFQKILQKSRERYQRLIQNSLDTIAVIHRNKWVFINESGVKLFQASGYQDMLGKNYGNFMEAEQQQIAQALLNEVLFGQSDSEIGEVIWRTYENRLIYTEMVCIPTSYFGEPAVQVILRDLSEKKKTEELMLRSEKLSVAGQLAAGIAHEIRNPLTAIKGFLQLMRTNERSSDQYFNIVFGELNRIELILSELLVLAKPQNSMFIKTNLKKLILEVTTLLETQANLNGVFIETIHSDNESILFGDPNQLKQVFINLIKNAIDAMPKGGTVRICTSLMEDQIKVTVQDEGEGIPEAVLKKMGDPFFTTKEKGTGLGLMITYNIIENHFGKVSLISEKGKGTTFTICFPIKEGRPVK
ncbi:PAS domain-containing protein [Metabacillus sp. KIGAM252]|uniref:histidine kinase n=1 Tax=Metabacillus flavus TaxID=2823519 RepID=A0ABS5LDZ3_9BACI|nr:PAS domain-containing protein [Metabacillus flavus]MBS2968629.1 PAS domain-containing protein [Metabacillus flavus]